MDNQEPLLELKPGDIFKAGDIEVRAFDIQGSNGIYTGIGHAKMPWLRHVSLRVEFSSIFINSDYQMLRGVVKTIFNPDSKLVVDLDGNDELSGDENSDDAASEDTDVEINYDGEISDVHIDTETGEIIVTDEDGTQTAYPVEKDEETGETTSVKIVDSSGDTWIVKDGKVTKGSQNNGNNTPDGSTNPQDLTLKEKLVVEVLRGFEQELEAWLNTYGKGPLSKEEMLRFLALPGYVPEDAEMVEGILSYVKEVKASPEAFTNNLFNQEGETLNSLLEGMKEDQPLESQLDEEQWQQAEETITTEAVDRGLLDWFTGMSYRTRAAKVLKEHWESQGIYNEVWVDESNREKVIGLLEMSVDATIQQEVDFRTYSEGEIFDLLLLTYKVPYWEANTINVEGWGSVVNWLRIQDDKIARKEGWGVAYANFVADVVNAAPGTLIGWVTGEHWRTGQELAWWEQALGVLDVIPAEGLAKAGLTALVIKIGGKFIDVAKVTDAAKNFIVGARAAGLKLMVRTADEILLYGKAGIKQIGKFANGVLQDIYWVYGGERILAKLAGVKYIIDDSKNIYKGSLEIVESGGKTGLKLAGKGILHGSGPVPGVIEVSKRVKSVSQFKNYYPKEGIIEFIFDTESKTFLVGKTPYGPAALSPHQKLAFQLGNEILSHNNNVKIIGGMFQRAEDGSIILKELSGHFYKNYERIPGVKDELKIFLESITELEVLWQ